MKKFDWNTLAVRRLVTLGLSEDQAHHDVTTRILVRDSWHVQAEIRSNQAGVVAGLPLVGLYFKAFNFHCRFRTFVKEGAFVQPGQRLAVIEGPARIVLSAERPALNALQHLSGIATYTCAQVKRLGRSKTKLLDTRKTLPGWRLLEKYAVRCGGATNHRMSLGDAILIKENHLRICRLAGADWVNDVHSFRQHRRLPLQVEVQTPEDLRDAVRLKPERVLLDNMAFSTLKKVIQKLRRELPSAEIEISGGVRPEELPRLSRLGVERISMGRLTHSAPVFDCSLDITGVDTR